MIHAAPPHGEYDFETYSEAGQVWDHQAQKWTGPPGAPKGKRGLPVVGIGVYTEHPTAEVLTFSYRLLPGLPKTRWRPGMPNPQALFDWLAAGGVMEAHNAMFEFMVWQNICVPKYGWPSLEPYRYQLRCSMATAHVNGLPGGLAALSVVLQLPVPKDAEGKRLLDKFSVPRNPTKKDARLRIKPPGSPDPNFDLVPAHRLPEHVTAPTADDVADFDKLQAYCDTDLDAEAGASERMYPMTAEELHFWLIDQEINYRGVGVDRPAIRDCIAVLRQALAHYGDEFREITGGLDPTQLQAVKGWLAARGLYTETMDEDARKALLKRADLVPHPPGGISPVRRVVEVLDLIGSASVKKLYAMENQACRDDRLRNLIIHHGARTGRPTGEGPQPLNLPRAGPNLKWCAVATCAKPFRPSHAACPWCFAPAPVKVSKWSPAAVDHVLAVMAHRSLELVEWFFGDALKCISGCVRGLFVAKPGHDLIASDYSAIEAVVIAVLAGEQWRIDAFHKKIDIYLASASKITGKTVEFYLQYFQENGDHHPDRQKIGKVAELGLGFGGWINAWLAFDDSGTFDEFQIKELIKAWRRESPAIVEMWGGQYRGTPWDPNRRRELFGVEGMAIQAIQFPGTVFDFNGIKFQVRDGEPGEPRRWWDGILEEWIEDTTGGRPGHLFIKLPSGRELIYRNVSLQPSARQADELSILYWTYNSNPKYGAIGWVPMQTFGGRLTENIVQATAHDILRFAIINLRAAGYPTVLHVYDEIVAEIPKGTGSIEEFERIMMLQAWWFVGWPVRAAGGWRGWRYRKG